MKNVVILGSTGSIGKSTLEVIAQHATRFQAVGLTAHRNWELLRRQCERFRPRWVTLTDDDALARRQANEFAGTELLSSADRVERMVSHPDCDIVLTAMVGAAGLHGTWSALQAGKTLCIANKEPLVLAGQLLMEEASRRSVTVLPVDSEHSALFQALQSGQRGEVARMILTASGGPFRTWSSDQMAHVTPEQALKHPTWEMGPKITIDSATMMNKALEIVEAKWLFGLNPDQIDVLVHPESIVHSLVEFVDGSTIAQLSPPDMKLPIQYALAYPERLDSPAASLDLARLGTLSFEAADPERFPALRLGYEVARQGGTCGAVLNASNEVAVDRFLRREISFASILQVSEGVLKHHHWDPNPSLGDLVKTDRWAREQAANWRD